MEVRSHLERTACGGVRSGTEDTRRVAEPLLQCRPPVATRHPGQPRRFRLSPEDVAGLDLDIGVLSRQSTSRLRCLPPIGEVHLRRRICLLPVLTGMLQIG
jgi:hypothetical protein